MSEIEEHQGKREQREAETVGLGDQGWIGPGFVRSLRRYLRATGRAADEEAQALVEIFEGAVDADVAATFTLGGVEYLFPDGKDPDEDRARLEKIKAAVDAGFQRQADLARERARAWKHGKPAGKGKNVPAGKGKNGPAGGPEGKR
jgi:hypothetical protein